LVATRAPSARCRLVGGTSKHTVAGEGLQTILGLTFDSGINSIVPKLDASDTGQRRESAETESEMLRTSLGIDRHVDEEFGERLARVL
jgi:hypothetical protein